MAVRILKAGSFLEVTFPYSEVAVRRFKASIPVRAWSKEKRAWRVPVYCSTHVLRLFPGAVIEDSGERVGLLRDLDPQRWEAVTCEWGCQLMDFQTKGVARLSQHDSALLADEPGLGKTIQAIVWASCKRVPGRNVVVAPSVVKWHWKREITRMLGDARVLVLGKTGEWPKIRSNAWDWLVVSYDLLARQEVYDVLKEETIAHFVLDEAHYIKNTGAKRSKAAIRIARRAKRVLALTGTPIQNRPIELIGLLRALGRMAPDAEYAYKFRFCAPRNNGFGWDYRGVSHAAELFQLLQPFMVRRLKADVLKELPEKRYTDIVVDLDDLDLDSYKGHESHMIRVMKEKKLTQADKNAMLMTLRRISALGKVSSAVDILQRERNEPGLSTVVFCSHVEPLRLLAKHLGSAVVLTGETAPGERDKMVQMFQEGHVRFALCSTMAMGTGVTLTRADTCYFLDLPWNPAAKEQAEDRVHRIGQAGKVQVIHLLGRNTIDERMARIMLDKRRIIDSAVDGIESDDAPEQSMLAALEAELQQEQPW